MEPSRVTLLNRQEYVLSLLSMADKESVKDMAYRVLASLGPEKKHFLSVEPWNRVDEYILKKKGIALGCFREGTLVGCMLATLPSKEERTLSEYSRIKNVPGIKENLDRFFVIHTLVDPAAQNQKVSGVFPAMRDIISETVRRRHGLAFISEDNLRHLYLCVGTGNLRIIDIVVNEIDRSRLSYCLYRSYGGAFPYVTPVHKPARREVVSIHDMDGQKACLDEGLIGVALETAKDAGQRRITSIVFEPGKKRPAI